MGFEPKIVGFLCDRSSYASADVAGHQRMNYAPNIRIVRVMCVGRVEPGFVVKAFKAGADGVLICGCHLGECPYGEANYQAARRISLLKKMLAQLGIEEERVRLEWIDVSEAARFVSVCNEMTAQMKELGPVDAAAIEGVLAVPAPELGSAAIK